MKKKPNQKRNRREFIKTGLKASASVYLATTALDASAYRRIPGANERIRVGVVGFSDRFRQSLFPAFNVHSKELNCEIVAVSDIWKKRREEGLAFLKEHTGGKINAWRNNQELYNHEPLDAVIISTADFQHALHTIEAVEAGCDAYVEKPFAETMADNNAAFAAVKKSGKIISIGSQRRSGANYQSAADYIQSGKFGKVNMVELTWNVNQPGRWRRPALVAQCNAEDTDWFRFLMNRPYEPWDARKFLEYRLFWPYSSGIPGQWMSHQIDTVHWFSGLPHPRSCVANGGIYQWHDGRQSWDTLTAVFDYGPEDKPEDGFQVMFTSRQHNGTENPAELYFSNGGELNLITNKVSSRGGLTKVHAEAMGMQPYLLEDYDLAAAAKVVAAANTGSDPLTSAHMRNWMECLRSRNQTNAPVEAGYSHSIANIMVTAAARMGGKSTFDPKTRQVMVNGRSFLY